MRIGSAQIARTSLPMILILDYNWCNLALLKVLAIHGDGLLKYR